MSAHDRRHDAVPAQIPPVGPPSSAGVMLVGALMYSAPVEAAEVLTLVSDDDMATISLTTVVAAIRRLTAAGKLPSPQLCCDELRRTGTLQHFASKVLADALTSGAQPMALREYAAAVVSESLRRRMESAGNALAEAAANAAESALAPMVSRAAESIADCARRLELLRGDV